MVPTPLADSLKLLLQNRLSTVLLVILILVSSLADGIGIASLAPAIQSLQGVEGAAEPGTLRYYFDSLLGWFGADSSLVAYLVVAAVFMTIKSFVKIAAQILISWLSVQVAADLRNTLLNNLFSAGWRYFSSRSVGQFPNAMSVEAAKGAGVFRYGAEIISQSLSICVYIGLVFVLSWQVLLGFLCFIAIAYFLFLPVLRYARKAVARQANSMQDLSQTIVDMLNGIKALKVMGIEKYEAHLMTADIETIRRSTVQHYASKSVMSNLSEPVVAFLLIIGLMLINRFEPGEFADISIALLLLYRAANAAMTMQSVYYNLISSHQYYISLLEKIRSSETYREVSVKNNPVGREVGFSNNLQFCDVELGHGEVTVLSNVSFDIPFGSLVVLSGPSGSGKSTIVDAIARLIETRRGDIKIDGHDIGDIDLATLRAQIGYVGQEIYLHNSTVRENIVMGRENVEEKDLERAVKLAGLDKVVAGLEMGLDTPVGERGSKLSGGQRQRVVLARALVARPNLLILDEFTASLDPETEEAIISELQYIKNECTILAVSHQPTIFSYADSRLIVENSTVTVEHSN